MIADSHAIVGNNTGRSHAPFTPFPPMAVLCKTIVCYHNQGIEIDTVKVQNISVITRIPPVVLL